MPTAEAVLRKASFRDLPVEGKRVLVRVDYNVPFDKSGNVTDDSRLRGSLATVQSLLQRKAKVILCAHLGRPKGQVNPKYSLKPVVKPLSDLLNTPVQFAEDCVGAKASDAVAKLQPGQVLLLENLRFHAEEEKNDPAFAKQLASLADLFVQDAFGAVHRAHASTAGVAAHLPSAAGELLEKELKFLNGIRSNPVRPYVALLGGAKVSDKIGVVEALIDRVNALFIGGAMAYTFLKAQNVSTGDSLVEADQVDFCRQVLDKAKSRNVQILLPVDHLVVQSIEAPEAAKTTTTNAIESGWKGVDVGPKTVELLNPVLTSAQTVFWNGPAGIFEVAAYSKGTMAMAAMAAEAARRGATVVIGGGDSVAAAAKAGVTKDITFISTGGGASLEFLEGQDLPGVSALPDA